MTKGEIRSLALSAFGLQNDTQASILLRTGDIDKLEKLMVHLHDHVVVECARVALNDRWEDLGAKILKLAIK